MKFSKDQAFKVLRPSVTSLLNGLPSDTQINQKVQELNALGDDDAKVIRRMVDPADPNDLREQIDDLRARVAALENRGGK